MGEAGKAKRKNGDLLKRVIRHKYFYMLSALAILYFIVFRYAPMWGLSMAFQKFVPSKGFAGSEWVGFQNFVDLFSNPFFWNLLRNTLVISLLKLALFFPLPIILAIMLNEVKHKRFKSVNQTVVYFPYFISWVVTASLTFFLFADGIGIVNKALVTLGRPDIEFLIDPQYFWPIIVGQTIWKETGYGTILFLSAISTIDLGQYEAAKIDGASRMQRIWYITLPGMMPTIVTVLILRLGQVFNVGYEQILLMYNPAVRDVAEVFDTFAYHQGVQFGQFSFGTTVGLFKGLVGVIFLLAANKIAKRLGSEGLF